MSGRGPSVAGMMETERTLTPGMAMTGCGRCIYGAGVMALGLICLGWGGFDPGQPVPKDFPGHGALAYVVAGFMVAAGAAVVWRRSAAWGATALTAYYAFIVVLLMNGRVVLAHAAEFGSYSGAAEQLAIAAGGLIIYATHAGLDLTRAARLVRLGRLAFGVCALLFGGAHFFYLKLTAPLVPQWLPPGQIFWAYATGAGFVAAGAAFLTDVRARLAAILLTAMLASFFVLVHVRVLLAEPTHWNWSEAALNLTVLGAAWALAGALARR